MHHAASGLTETDLGGSRREFLKLPLAATVAGMSLGSGPGSNAAGTCAPGIPGQRARGTKIAEYDEANTQIGHIVPSTLTDDDLLFLQQIGLRSVVVIFNDTEAVLDRMRQAQERFAQYGIQICGGWNQTYRSLRIQLGQPGRDEDIGRFQNFLRDLGRLGIRVAPYDFHPGNTYTTSMVKTRGYTTREFSVEDFRAKVEKQRFDREYSAEEIWEYYTYFVNAVLPVAEEAGVKLALHPDDPPLAKMNGVAKLFTHYEGYRRAEEIARGSPSWGLTFCVGTWSEGGDRMGKNVFEMIRDFGERGKIHLIHFRNVSSPLPRFHETFPDDGYLDMYQVMKSLRQVGFRGCAVPDHIPKLVGDEGHQRAGLAYCIASMRTMLRRANEEVG